jgi:hypothetical protein
MGNTHKNGVRFGHCSNLQVALAQATLEKSRELKRVPSDTMEQMDRMAMPTQAMKPPVIPNGLSKMLEEYCVNILGGAPVQVPVDDSLDLHQFPGVVLHSIARIATYFRKVDCNNPNRINIF